MISVILRKVPVLGMIAAASLALLLSSCRMYEPMSDCGEEGECHPHAKVCHNPTMHALACDLDHLEAQIDKYGSVVAMQPSVWGQARLTKYRDEFEKEMFKAYGTFTETLQGSLSRSDQAYLANATAISAAIGGQQAGAIAPNPVTVQTNNTQTTPTAIPVPAATPNTDAFAGFSSISRTAVGTPLQIGFKQISTGGITLEPTIQLDQKQRFLDHLNQIRRNNEGDDTADAPGYSLNLVRMPVSVLPGKCTQKGYGAEITLTMKPYIGDELLPSTFRTLVVNDIVDLLALPAAKIADLVTADMPVEANKPKSRGKTLTQIRMDLFDSAPQNPEVATAISQFMKGASKQRVASLPLPPSQVIKVLGMKSLARICKQVDTVISSHKDGSQQVYVLDARGTLRDEANAAYELLNQPQNLILWTNHCTPDLVFAVRSRRDAEVEDRREKFLNAANARLDNVTADLAWAIVVEAALLNDKLKKDMHDAAANTGSPIPEADNFFLPGPTLPSEARHAFNEYVRVRWPIHVFALDPMSQDQNIADVYSKRQEMQLALTLAFASGNINANNMLRYARRIEKDMETININKTQVGFSHGAETFGWRFYPRFQSPAFESNATTIFRDQLWGGPSRRAELGGECLEPGMRECVAIVMMPAFVPYVTCETSSNWFKLANPKHKEFQLQDAVRLGGIVKSVQNCSSKIKNANCYRDGDLTRLLAKAKQLEERLPLQDMKVQVPYENTLGGFEMFNTGVTDLAPELTGWYGGPGAFDKADTQLTLVGDHFSIHHTKVIAGGQDCAIELVSRQIMHVTIPKGAATSTRDDPITANAHGGAGTAAAPTTKSITYIDVHLATPYGVTSHLEIPVVPSTAADPKTGLAWAQSSVEVAFLYKDNGITPPAPPQVWPPLALTWDPTVLGSPPANTVADGATVTLTFGSPYGDQTAKPFGDGKVTLNVPFSVDSKTNALAIDSTTLATALFTKFGTFFGPRNSPVPITAKSATLTLTLAGTPVAGKNPINVSGSLVVTWQNAAATQPVTPCPAGCGPIVIFQRPEALPCPPAPAPKK